MCFTFLQVSFEYPDILRQPAPDILRKFHAGGSALILLWYGMTLTALLFVPIVVLVHGVVAASGPFAGLWLASTFGIIAGVVQALGFLRWVFVVPYLATTYVAPTASAAQREAVAVVFEALHRYAGVAIGEHLGYLSTGAWTLLIALALWKVALVRPWLGITGMLTALGIVVGVFETPGWEAAGVINAVSYLAWSVWLVVVGLILFVMRPRHAGPAMGE